MPGKGTSAGGTAADAASDAGAGGGLSDEAINVSLTLGDTKLSLRDGVWVQEGADLDRRKMAAKVTILQDEVIRLRGEANDERLLRDEAVRQQEVLAFRNELLTKMLAVAQLDAEKFARELEKEKLKSEALKWELVRLSRATAHAVGGGGATAASGVVSRANVPAV